MPARNSSKPTPSASEPTADPAAPAEVAAEVETEAPAEDLEAVPMNRAERRAKGKGAAKPQVVGKIQPVRVNNGHGPRSYANRRSG